MTPLSDIYNMQYTTKQSKHILIHKNNFISVFAAFLRLFVFWYLFMMFIFVYIRIVYFERNRPTAIASLM